MSTKEHFGSYYQILSQPIDGVNCIHPLDLSDKIILEMLNSVIVRTHDEYGTWNELNKVCDLFRGQLASPFEWGYQDHPEAMVRNTTCKDCPCIHHQPAAWWHCNEMQYLDPVNNLRDHIYNLIEKLRVLYKSYKSYDKDAMYYTILETNQCISEYRDIAKEYAWQRASADHAYSNAQVEWDTWVPMGG
jgi:hypothetical protein